MIYGQRTRKVGTADTRYIYDPHGRLIGEYLASGVMIQETVYLGDLPVAVLTPAGTYNLHADHLNTPRVITDSSNQVIWRWDSDPFGTTLANEDPDNNGVKFTYNPRFPGQYFDKESGLHYNHFRDYDPKIGRYIQSDPIGLAGGLNTYAYVENNPLSYTDPLGLMGFGGMPPGVQGGPGQNTTPSSPSPVSQVGGAVGDFIENFGDMRDANTIGADKYFHCKANCQAAKRGAAGKHTACLISDYREAYGYYKDGASASSADQVANHWGRDRAGGNASCEQICQIFRPHGLPSRY